MWIRMRFVVRINRSDYLEQRRPMMQWWADFVMAADHGSMMKEDKGNAVSWMTCRS